MTAEGDDTKGRDTKGRDTERAASPLETEIGVLTELLREAEEFHGPYEAVALPHHWSEWYAAFITARQHGRQREQASEDAGSYTEQRPRNAAARPG